MSAATPSVPSATERRVSARVGSISESATLAVDAKAKALAAKEEVLTPMQAREKRSGEEFKRKGAETIKKATFVNVNSRT